MADRCSPSSAPFPPRPPQEVAFPCSVGSQVVRRSPTSPARACPSCGYVPSRTGLRHTTEGALEIFRFSCMLFFSVRGFLDYAGPDSHSRLTRLPCCLPPARQGVGILIWRFSKLNHPAHRCLGLRFARHLAMCHARLEARMESLSPFLWGSCIPYNMPVYPGARRKTPYARMWRTESSDPSHFDAKATIRSSGFPPRDTPNSISRPSGVSLLIRRDLREPDFWPAPPTSTLLPLGALTRVGGNCRRRLCHRR